MKRRDKFDYVLVETTGLADPGPVAQTFFMDDEIHEEFSLDGIVTLVDAAHIEQQLGRSDESTEQVAFADVLVLNKTDLVEGEELDRLEARAPGDEPNGASPAHRAGECSRRHRTQPRCLRPGSGAWSVAPLSLSQSTRSNGLESIRSIAVVTNSASRMGLTPRCRWSSYPTRTRMMLPCAEGAEWCVRQYAELARPIRPGEEIPVGEHVNLQLDSVGRKSFFFEVNEPARIGLYTQHTAEEFDLRLTSTGGAMVEPEVERTWVAQHEHDDEVGSIAIERDGDVDPAKLNTWLSTLLRERGVDIFRMKGFISLAGESRRFVFQGVHMLFDGQPDREWGDAPRPQSARFHRAKPRREEHARGVRGLFDLNVEVRKGVLRRGWSGSVGDYAIAGGWASRGEALAVGDAAGVVYVFDGKSGATNWAQQSVHEGGVLAMAVHPNGTEFATAGQDGRVLVWPVAEGHLRQAIEVDNAWVGHVSWSPDGQWLAVACSRQVRVYDANGAEIWRAADYPSTVSAIAWSSTEELATACYGRVAFRDGASGELRQQLEWKGSLVSMVLSPDGDIVACGSQDRSVHFWRRSSGQDSMMSGYAGKPSALAFDDTGTLLATGGGEAVTVWSFEGSGPEGTRPGVLELHVESITTLAFARRAMRLASGGRDGAVVVWSLERDGDGGPIGAAVVTGTVAGVYWRPDGRALAALDAQGGVTVWRVG